MKKLCKIVHDHAEKVIAERKAYLHVTLEWKMVRRNSMTF